MEKLARKLMQTGYGLGLLSLVQARKAVGQVKKELHLDEKESRRLAQALVNSSQKASQEAAQAVGRNVEQALVRSRVLEPKEAALLKGMLKKRLQRLQRMGKKK